MLSEIKIGELFRFQKNFEKILSLKEQFVIPVSVCR